MKAADDNLDLPTLFSTTPLILRHSPLDPTCPARIAQAVEKAKQATKLRKNQEAGVNPPNTPAAGNANPITPITADVAPETTNAPVVAANKNIVMNQAQ